MAFLSSKSTLLIVASVLCGIAPAQMPAPVRSPKLETIDAVVNDAIRRNQIPGAVVLVWHNGQVIYRKAFGQRALEPKPEQMTADTIFDLASLTKVLATTTAVMQLMERGEVRLNDPIAKYLPEFANNGKEDITVRQLLAHHSGLPEDLSLSQPWQGREVGFRMAYEMRPVFPPGSRFLYSDVNFIMLGALVERVSGRPLEAYCDQNIFAPLDMTHTRFLPPADWQREIAPTEYDDDGKMLRGVVHDPTARRMGGVAGHAGLFSTADDMAKFAQAVLQGSAILSSAAIQKMTTPQQPPTSETLRGLGWDIDSPFSTNRGELLPVGSFGHTGFTGTSLWIDPTTQTFIVILSNAVHPRGKGTAVALRTKIATAVAASLDLTTSEQEELRWKSITGYNEAQTASRRMVSRNGTVQTGIEVLEAQNFAELRGGGSPKKVGLLTNQTGVDLQGRRTIDVLAHAPGVSLNAIFSPEHGVTGTLDTTSVGNSRDVETQIPIYSVYGAKDSARRPSLEILRQLDAVVIDIQDAGVPFYTYESTLGYFLEAAAKAGIEVVVLDRPNPITGAFVQGPPADPGRESFVNYAGLPLRHGMTIGELAQMFNAERKINARLKVVPMAGWMRGDWYDATGLEWINPSPNLRSVTAAALYPGVAMIEGTNVSVGRGFDTPFEVVGAPWINAREFSRYLNERNISGVRFVPVSYIPTANPYANLTCNGVNVVLTDRNALDAVELGIELASALHKLYPQQYQMGKMIELVPNQQLLHEIETGEDPRRIAQDWQEPLEKFEQVRQKYLIYK
ncbi:MAG: DUF1343 domain-containing protein [Acidobacteriales bacterium]|nr:DUF1343 domain-containing protein [Terriglobales bacterium]